MDRGRQWQADSPNRVGAPNEAVELAAFIPAVQEWSRRDHR